MSEFNCYGAYRLEDLEPAEPEDLEPAEPEYVHVVNRPEYWILLPGDTAAHKLTEQEAKALFRQLEAVV